MNIFQILGGIAVFLFLILIARSRGILAKRLFFMLVTLFGLVLIGFPNLSSKIANALGIGRGADLVFYLFILFSWFWFMIIENKIRKSDEKITKLVRYLALKNSNQPSFDYKSRETE